MVANEVFLIRRHNLLNLPAYIENVIQISLQTPVKTRSLSFVRCGAFWSLWVVSVNSLAPHRLTEYANTFYKDILRLCITISYKQQHVSKHVDGSNSTPRYRATNAQMKKECPKFFFYKTCFKTLRTMHSPSSKRLAYHSMAIILSYPIIPILQRSPIISPTCHLLDWF